MAAAWPRGPQAWRQVGETCFRTDGERAGSKMAIGLLAGETGCRCVTHYDGRAERKQAWKKVQDMSFESSRFAWEHPPMGLRVCVGAGLVENLLLTVV